MTVTRTLRSALRRTLAPLALSVLAGFALCACGGIELYNVTREPVADCEIRPQGEFCGDLGAPVQQVIAVERKDEVTVLHFDEETWVAQGIDGERQVLKETLITRDPGPCTSTLRKVLVFSENSTRLQGSLEISTRIEGAAACGETPRGDRKRFSLLGDATNSI
jgi:hypothetical protein